MGKEDKDKKEDKMPKEEKKKEADPEAKKKKKKKRHTPRNYRLTKGGIMRYSRPRMYKKKALHRPKLRKAIEESKDASSKKPEYKRKASRMIKKEIGGEKNGGYRMVRKTKMPRFYPTEERPRKLSTRKTAFSQHKHKLKKGIVPGTILILLAGRHKGKRVVCLKQLSSGLLLVTGPFHLNGCPLRRVNQIYTIATKTRLDIDEVKVGNHLNDKYFKRQKLKKPKHTEGEIFDTKKEKYAVSEERKKDQVEVDTQILNAIREHPEKKLMFGYLGSLFHIRKNEYPHKMKF